MVTGVIETFTETGVRLESGEELEADIIVTATGLSLQVLGGAELSVDGERRPLPELVTYKGPMFSGVPNMAITFGYINASWTLKADLVSRFIVRMLKYMDKHGYDEALPLAPPADMAQKPYIELQSGYIKRGEHLMAKQGTRSPWVVNQSYVKDLNLLLRAPVADEGIRFFSRNPGGRPRPEPDLVGQA
jgi:monooxygenase